MFRCMRGCSGLPCVEPSASLPHAGPRRSAGSASNLVRPMRGVVYLGHGPDIYRQAVARPWILRCQPAHCHGSRCVMAVSIAHTVSSHRYPERGIKAPYQLPGSHSDFARAELSSAEGPQGRPNPFFGKTDFFVDSLHSKKCLSDEGWAIAETLNGEPLNPSTPSPSGRHGCISSPSRLLLWGPSWFAPR
jgi:hypothetical protein